MNLHPGVSGYRLIETLTREHGRDGCAVVSSFGADSSVLLHLVAEVDARLPVLFIDTGMHFPETLEYRDRLIEHLGLADVRSVTPPNSSLVQLDPQSVLHKTDPDACCDLRKVRPLADALEGFRCWFNGRKQFQGQDRGQLANIEHEPAGRVRVNPLFNWTQAALDMYKTINKLPRHPLEINGYRSIGCRTCTVPGCNARRDGRWADTGKTECGIFFNSTGKALRVSHQSRILHEGNENEGKSGKGVRGIVQKSIAKAIL